MFHEIKHWLDGLFNRQRESHSLCVETAMGCITTNINERYDITGKKKVSLETLGELNSLCDTANETFNKRLKIFDPTEDDIRNLDVFVQGLYNPVIFIDTDFNIRTANKQFSRLISNMDINLIGKDIRTFINSNILEENDEYFRNVLNATKSLSNGTLEYRPVQNSANILTIDKKYGVSIRFSSYKFDGYDIVVMMEITVLHESEINGRQKLNGNIPFIIM